MENREISEQALLALERQTGRLIEILSVAVVIGLTAVFAVPIVGAVVGKGSASGFFGSAWTTAWLFGLFAVHAVNFWWSNVE